MLVTDFSASLMRCPCVVQAMLPFSQEVLDYIERLDPEADCELLRSELPWLKEAALHTLYISTMLLKVHPQCRHYCLLMPAC